MKRYSELAVGITVILALIILFGGLLWFKGYAIRRDTYDLTVFFPQASGLAKGDPVEVAGVVQGSVDDIAYEKGRARVGIKLSRNAELYNGTAAVIANYGIMGQKFVAMDPGQPGLGKLDVTKPLVGRFDPGMGEMMTTMGGSLARSDTLLTRINHMLAQLDSAGGTASVIRTLKNTERASENLADISGASRESVKRTLTNLDQATAELNSLLKQKGPALRGTLDNLNRASARFDTLTGQLSSLSQELHATLDQVRSTKSTTGALMNDRELYDRLLSTVARTDSLLLDFKKNPRKYLKFSVF